MKVLKEHMVLLFFFDLFIGRSYLFICTATLPRVYPAFLMSTLIGFSPLQP